MLDKVSQVVPTGNPIREIVGCVCSHAGCAKNTATRPSNQCEPTALRIDGPRGEGILGGEGWGGSGSLDVFGDGFLEWSPQAHEQDSHAAPFLHPDNYSVGTHRHISSRRDRQNESQGNCLGDRKRLTAGEQHSGLADIYTLRLNVDSGSFALHAYQDWRSLCPALFFFPLPHYIEHIWHRKAPQTSSSANTVRSMSQRRVPTAPYREKRAIVSHWSGVARIQDN